MAKCQGPTGDLLKVDYCLLRLQSKVWECGKDRNVLPNEGGGLNSRPSSEHHGDSPGGPPNGPLSGPVKGSQNEHFRESFVNLTTDLMAKS
jgi:hypothetical protein